MNMRYKTTLVIEWDGLEKDSGSEHYLAEKTVESLVECAFDRIDVSRRPKLIEAFTTYETRVEYKDEL